MAAFSEMIDISKAEYREVLTSKKKGLILDIWGVAIKKEHSGKGILHKMMLAN